MGTVATAPVCSGFTSNMKGFVCLGRKALSIVAFVAVYVRVSSLTGMLRYLLLISLLI